MLNGHCSSSIQNLQCSFNAVLRTSILNASVDFKFPPDAAAADAITAGMLAVFLPFQQSVFPVPIFISDKRETTSVVGCAFCHVFALQSCS